MTATYTLPPVADRDYVRLLISDTNVAVASNARLQDEEIDQVLANELMQHTLSPISVATRYFAAATCLEILLSRDASKGKGLERVDISGLAITQGSSGDTVKAIQAYIIWLRGEGERLAAKERGTSTRFRAVRRTSYSRGGSWY